MDVPNISVSLYGCADAFRDLIYLYIVERKRTINVHETYLLNLLHEIRLRTLYIGLCIKNRSPGPLMRKDKCPVIPTEPINPS